MEERPGPTTFSLHPLWLASFRFTVVLIAAAIAGMGLLWRWSGPTTDGDIGFVVGLVATAILVAAVALWTSRGWARREIRVVDDRLEEHGAWSERTIRFRDVERIAVRVWPGLTGVATVTSHDARIDVSTGLAGADRLIRLIRRRLVEAGREDRVDPERLDVLLETAVCGEHRVQRLLGDYPWLPWFAIVSPLAVVLLGYATRLPAGARLLWAAVFAVFPWLVFGLTELAILGRFFRTADAIAPTTPGRDTRYEREMRLRAVLLGYFVYLGVNLVMLWRHA